LLLKGDSFHIKEREKAKLVYFAIFTTGKLFRPAKALMKFPRCCYRAPMTGFLPNLAFTLVVEVP